MDTVGNDVVAFAILETLPILVVELHTVVLLVVILVVLLLQNADIGSGVGNKKSSSCSLFLAFCTVWPLCARFADTDNHLRSCPNRIRVVVVVETVACGCGWSWQPEN
jgi:hypothetical protein